MATPSRASSCTRRNSLRVGVILAAFLIILAFALLQNTSNAVLNDMMQISAHALITSVRELSPLDSAPREDNTSSQHNINTSRQHQANLVTHGTHSSRPRGSLANVTIITEEDCSNFVSKLVRPGDQFCKAGPYTIPGRSNESNASGAHRIAFVIRGESFRRNTAMYDRIISATPKSEKCQLGASETHVKHLIEPLEKCGVVVDVFLVTWRPDGKRAELSMKAMSDTYGARVVYADWANHKTSIAPGVNGQLVNYQNAIASVAKHYKTTNTRYDGMLLVRADLIFKRPLINLPNAKWSTVLYQYHIWELGGGYPAANIEQRLPETLFWYPWRFLNCVHKLGWKEHDSAFLHTIVGFRNMNFMMPDEFHDSNSAADWNPLYSQACRGAQRYDIHGGPAMLLFNVVPVETVKKADWLGDSFIKNMKDQGEPQVIPPIALVMHSWKQKSPEVPQKMKPAFAIDDQAQSHSFANEKIDGIREKTGWLIALQSMRRSFELLMKNEDFLGKKVRHPSYRFDRVVFARLDHYWRAGHFSVYAHDTAEAVFVGFGAIEFPTVPTVIVMSHEVAWNFGKYLTQGSWDTAQSVSPVDEGEAGVKAWLAKATGMQVKPALCNRKC